MKKANLPESYGSRGLLKYLQQDVSIGSGGFNDVLWPTLREAASNNRLAIR
jgi:hypothetical protein